MKKLHFGKIITFIILSFSFASCSYLEDALTENNLPASDNQEIGYISLGKTSLARSSVIPAESEDALLSKLTNVMLQCVWSSPNAEPVVKNITGTTWTEFIEQFADPGYPLQTGTYSFTFNAKLDDVYFQAIKNDNITAGTTKTLRFNLKPWNMTTNTEITTGGINITWNITGSPASATVTFADDTPQTYTSFTDNKLTYTKSGLAAGDYNLTVDFKSSDASLPTLSTWTGKVRVAAGITTTKEINWSVDATTYTITWNLNDGNITDITYVQAAKYIHKSETITLPAADVMSKDGYSFDGWYDNASFSGDAITSIPKYSTGNKSLYAKWNLETYTITYNCIVGNTNQTTYTIEDNAFTLTAPSGTDPGNPALEAGSYYFNGWYNNSAYIGTAITEIDPATTHEDMELYAAQSNNIHVASSTSTPYAGSADNNGLFSSSPVESIATAVQKIVEYNTPIGWIIVIDDNLTGTQIINNSSLTTSKLASSTPLQISGAGATAKVLNGGSLSEGNNRTTLTINTAVPVSITNLEITGGRGTVDSSKYYGGGLYLAANSKVDLGDGVKIYGNTCDFGGGVYVAAGATLCMHGTAIIGDTEKTNISSINSETGFSDITSSVSDDAEYSSWKCANYAVGNGNSAPGGGGIYSLGTVALGYSSYTNETTNSTSTLTGGIYNNASNRAGGICGFNDNNIIVMNSGNIMYNSSDWGGGVYERKGTFTLKGGKINSNYTKGYGAAVYAGNTNTTSFIMNGGEIKENHAFSEHGAVHVEYGTFSMTGGTISGNKAHSTNPASDITGGVYLFCTASITGGTIKDNLDKSDRITCSILCGNCDVTLGGSADIPYVSGAENVTGYANTIIYDYTLTVSKLGVTNSYTIACVSPANSDGSTRILQPEEEGGSVYTNKFTIIDPSNNWDPSAFTINSDGYAIPN